MPDKKRPGRPPGTPNPNAGRTKSDSPPTVAITLRLSEAELQALKATGKPYRQIILAGLAAL